MKSRIVLLIALLFPMHFVFALDAKDLVGTWILQSYYVVVNGVEQPWCDLPFGTITYTDAGNMSVSINCMKLGTNQVTDDPTDMVFYSGPFTVQAPNVITHHVLNSAEVVRVGADEVRYADLQGDQVVLIGVGLKGPIKITWKRQKN